jgi:hypothetical protein
MIRRRTLHLLDAYTYLVVSEHPNPSVASRFRSGAVDEAAVAADDWPEGFVVDRRIAAVRAT